MTTKTVKKKINRTVAVDLGNGLVNIRSIYPDGSPYLITLPSAFGYLSSIGETVGGLGRKYNVNTYMIDNVEYVWGEDVYKIPNFITTASLLESRYETNNYKTLVKIILGRVARDIGLQPTEQILISTGVPSEQTKEVTVNSIRGAFFGSGGDYKGAHRVSVDDEEFTVNVADVSVISQPLATVFASYLNDKGFVADKTLMEKDIAVIDIGGGTTDLDTLMKFNRMNDFESIGHGFQDVYKEIQEKINKDNGGKGMGVNDYEILDIIEEAEIVAKEKNETPVYTYRGSEKQPTVDFTETYLHALDRLGMNINVAISRKWSDFDKFDIVYLVGGSAKRVAKYISILQEPDYPNDPGLSNVEGYYNFGVAEANKVNEQ